MLHYMTSYLTAGCMAERLKTQLLESDKMVDLVAGPGEESVVGVGNST